MNVGTNSNATSKANRYQPPLPRNPIAPSTILTRQLAKIPGHLQSHRWGFVKYRTQPSFKETYYFVALALLVVYFREKDDVFSASCPPKGATNR